MDSKPFEPLYGGNLSAVDAFCSVLGVSTREVSLHHNHFNDFQAPYLSRNEGIVAFGTLCLKPISIHNKRFQTFPTSKTDGFVRVASTILHQWGFSEDIIKDGLN